MRRNGALEAGPVTFGVKPTLQLNLTLSQDNNTGSEYKSYVIHRLIEDDIIRDEAQHKAEKTRALHPQGTPRPPLCGCRNRFAHATRSHI